MTKATKDGKEKKMFNSSERQVESIVPPQFVGTPLDTYLATRFTYRTKSQWQECISAGIIRLNDKTIAPNTILQKKDKITFLLTNEMKKEPNVNRDYQIIAETPHYLVVNKPGNLPVHPSGKYFANTLLRFLFPTFGNLYPVNRLDRETSGIILFAKDAQSAKKLSALFAGGTVKKIYNALVYGRFPQNEVQADGYIFTDTNSQVHKKQKFSFDQPQTEKYQTAKTNFQLLEYRNGYSLLDCTPQTGRTHQIRATLLALGYPMVGDKLYGSDESIFLRFREDAMTQEDISTLKMDCQALHARHLEFVSPFDKSECVYEAPCPFTFPEEPM